MNTSHYIFSVSFGVENQAMRTIHAVLDTNAGAVLIQADVIQIGCWQHLVTSEHISRLWDANGIPLHLLGIVLLRLRLCNSHFRMSFISAKQLPSSMIIVTEVSNHHVREIRCKEVLIEIT